MIRTTLRAALAAALSLVVATSAPGTARSELTLPRVSPDAKVTQTIGLTDFTLTYSRPGVKGRKIWGELVPYGEIWRTGANEATTFTCSDPVTIGGKTLPAGTYAFYTLPTAGEWDVIFSNAKGAWGSNEYTPEKDALRLKVKPQEAPHQEWMSIGFENLAPASGDLVVRWEKLMVAVPIQVNLNDKAMANIRAALAERKPDDWQTLHRAAQFCFNAGIQMDEAMAWEEQSVATKETYANLSLLADMKMKAGKSAEAIAAAEKALKVGKDDPNKPNMRPTEEKLSAWKGKKG